MQSSRFDLTQVSEQLSTHASVFTNAVTHAHNQLIIRQSFNILEFFHDSPNQKTPITRVFSSSDVALYAARKHGLVCAIKKTKSAASTTNSNEQR